MSNTIAVAATDPKYFGLKHMPSGIALDANGQGTWPADQFTFRLILEGSIKESGASAPPTAAAAPAAPAAPAAAAEPVTENPLTHLRELVDEADHELARLEQGAAPAPSVNP
jgi:hypothetical protein